MSSGSLAGFPVVDIRATLLDGSYHDVDSSVLAFQIAARQAFRNAMPKCGVQLLEPVMKVGPSPARHVKCLQSPASWLILFRRLRRQQQQQQQQQKSWRSRNTS